MMIEELRWGVTDTYLYITGFIVPITGLKKIFYIKFKNPFDNEP